MWKNIINTQLKLKKENKLYKNSILIFTVFQKSIWKTYNNEKIAKNIRIK